MSKRVCHLDKIQKFVDEVYKDSDNNIVLVAVELDEKGYPLGRMQKVKATPALALGGISMLEQYLEDSKLDAYKKIDMAGELSDKLVDLFKKLGVEDMDEMENTLNNITDPEIKSQLRDAIKKLKDQF